MEYYSALKKEENLDTWDNVDEPEKHSKSNKPDMEGKIQHGLMYMWNNNITIIIINRSAFLGTEQNGGYQGLGRGAGMNRGWYQGN